MLIPSWRGSSRYVLAIFFRLVSILTIGVKSYFNNRESSQYNACGRSVDTPSLIHGGVE